jgi:ABC-type nickel/cobalt efflux system permease component RcnA
MKRLLVLLVLVFLVGSNVSYAAQNPFISGGAKEDTVQKKIKAPGVFHNILDLIAKWQKQLKIKLTAFARDIRTNPYGKSFWLFLLVSFAYGVVHALGPGHGKTISCSYFLSRRGSILQGLLMGNLVASMHVISAVVIVTTVYFILKTAGMTTFENLSATLQKLSYLILLLLGLFLAFKSVQKLRTGKGHVHAEDPQPADLKSLVAVSLATGLVPCPGAAIILSFAIMLNIFVAGFIAMFCIALGMGITTSAFDLVAITSRKTVLRFFDHNSRAFLFSHGMISLTGSLAIIIISGLLLLSQI